MGAGCCKPAPDEEGDAQFGSANRNKPWKRPKWRSDDPMTEAELVRMQEVFWDTEPHYGGSREIWDALKAACAADNATAKVIIETAGIIVASQDMTICYDAKGAKYDLPKYVLSPPTNLIKTRRLSSSADKSGSGRLRGQVELPAVAGPQQAEAPEH